jgi:putative addiction module CopG family antidote
MTISLSKEAKAIVEAAVASGQYAAPEAVLDASLLLLADRQQKLAWLRNKIQRSIERGGSVAPEVVDAEIERWHAEAKARGY